MKAIVLKCKPGSRFHFGKYSLDADTALNDSDEIMHSDTLFSALVNIYQDLFGDAQELVDAFTKAQVKISSVLPCFQQRGNYIWMLPKPVCFNLFQANEYKVFRAIRYISKVVWENILNPLELEQKPETYKLLAKKRYAVHKDEILLPSGLSGSAQEESYQSIAVSHLVTLPKVRVRDRPEDKTIYQVTVTEIADNTAIINDLYVHYYFLLDTEVSLSELIQQQLMTAIQLLPENGIGGERNTIGSLDSIDIIENWELKMNHSISVNKVTASLLYPAEKERADLMYYRFMLRGGRRLGKKGMDETKVPVYLKTVRMIEEGAVLNQLVTGGLADISPDNTKSYLRNGLAFCLPVHNQWIPDYE